MTEADYALVETYTRAIPYESKYQIILPNKHHSSTYCEEHTTMGI